MPQRSGLGVMSKNTEINLSFGRTDAARQGRMKQLQRWNNSEVAKESGTERKNRKSRKIKFQDNVIFHSAVISGDRDEVERLLKDGYDVNCVNDDGLTGLHQSCIEEDWEMVQLLLEYGANVNAVDYEGWTPLHAAASCSYMDICRTLLDHGADPSIVNNEGHTAVEQALDQDDEEIAAMIQKEIEKQGISVEEVKSKEHRLLMQEAVMLKDNPTLEFSLSRQGATPLHVAAAKGYIDVMNVLIKARKSMLDSIDKDGWSPLHAAVYWGEFPAAELLVLTGADFYSTTLLGETVEDLANEEDEDQLGQLKKLAGAAQMGVSNKQRSLRSSSGSDVKPSPQTARRRLSKELSRESLKMDMRNEKKTLENAPNNIAEETEPSSSPNLLVEDKNLAELIEGTENAKDKVTEKEPSLKGTPGKEPGGEVSFVMKVGSNNVAKESGPHPAKESSEETPLEDNSGGRKEEIKTDEAAVPYEKEPEQQREKPSSNGSEVGGTYRTRSVQVRKVGGSVHSLIRQLETKIETEGAVVPRPKSEQFSSGSSSSSLSHTNSGSDVRRFSFQAKTVSGSSKTSPLPTRKESVTKTASPSLSRRNEPRESSPLMMESPSLPHKQDLVNKTEEPASGPAKKENRISITTKATSRQTVTVTSPPQTSPTTSPIGSPKLGQGRRMSARNKISYTIDSLMKRASISSTSSETGPEKETERTHKRQESDNVFKDLESVRKLPSLPTSSQNGATAVLPTAEEVPPVTEKKQEKQPPDSLDMSRSSSISSNLSTPANELNVSRTSSRDDSQRSEMERKRQARRERKHRKATQGVSQEDFRKLMESEEVESTPKQRSEESSTESPMVSKRNLDLDTSCEGGSSIFETPPPSSTKTDSTVLGDSMSCTLNSIDSCVTLSEMSPQTSASQKDFVMSAYKPSSRPQPKILLDPLQPDQPQDGLLWTTPEMERRKNVKTDGEPSSLDAPSIVKERNVEEKDTSQKPLLQPAEQTGDDSQFLSPGDRARSKSVARRKKKEKRRSTGIKFSDDDESVSEEDLPEELKKIVSKEKKKKAEESKDRKDRAKDQTEKETRKEAEHKDVEKFKKRIKELEDMLQAEQDKYADLMKRNNESLKKNEHAKKLNSDLMKKCDDTARALDQQRQETLKYKEEVVKLKDEMAATDVMKGDNQRLKDENKALIRVIAKMSRAPGVNA